VLPPKRRGQAMVTLHFLRSMPNPLHTLHLDKPHPHLLPDCQPWISLLPTQTLNMQIIIN